MTREEVIKGLECCMLSYKDGCDECPYIGKGMCQELLGEHALALLKAQEPVSVQKKQMEMVGLQTWDWVCGNCGQTVLFGARFCPWCGRAVKWE